MTSLPNTAQALIASMQAAIDTVLAPLVDGYSSVVLFDFPDHNNVGDSAIFLGEMAYLERKGLSPAYICTADACDYGRLASRYADALILLHGGGNFGDIWPWNHERREAILDRFRGRRIVQLAQTIKFHTPEALARTREVIQRHGDFVLLVRDTRSYEFASAELDCTVMLCPDMAFCLGPLARRGSPVAELLFLMRDDQERSAARGELAGFDLRRAIVNDWPVDDRAMNAATKALALAESLMGGPAAFTDADTRRNGFFTALARRRLEEGLKLLSAGEFVITDRLHAFILALLMDIPRTVIDNNYGKISGFIDTFLPPGDGRSTYPSLAAAYAAWERRSRQAS